MIEAVVDHSAGGRRVGMDEPTLAVMNELRDFMFERVYQAPSQREQQERAIELLRALMAHHTDNPDEIPASYRQGGAPVVVQAADYVAGMTDRFALTTYARAFGTDAAAAIGLPGASSPHDCGAERHHSDGSQRQPRWIPLACRYWSLASPIR